MYKHILIPTDGSKFSAHAVAHGVELAKVVGAKVTGLFVAPAPTPLVFEGLLPVDYMQPDEHAALTARAAARHLGAIEQAAQQAGVAFEGVTVTGEYPAEAIVKLAASHKCDLIVMASHGRHGLTSLLLGSETQKVLTDAKVPVLVCR
ncbi:universal stress protein [Brevundimonas sp.]|uniref:universal stress protein n=1 Tax=Brevundimonas sp. TaxID=1871086 RepID=UPI002731B3FF|nr:universal stress protein [Brevundimonas sp.]MDP1912168.1 universal stress protein [Brevundimonas sp.]